MNEFRRRATQLHIMSFLRALGVLYLLFFLEVSLSLCFLPSFDPRSIVILICKPPRGD